MFELGQKETFICDQSHHEYTFVDELEGEGGRGREGRGRERGREGRGREEGKREGGGGRGGIDKEMVGRRGEGRKRGREGGGRMEGGGKGGKDRKKINVMLMLYKLALSLWSPPPPPNNAYSSFKVKQVASRNIFLFTIPQKIGHIKQAIKFELP